MTEPQNYQCMEWTSLKSVFSSFPDLFKHEIDQLFSTILFNQTTTWSIGCFKLIQIAMWPVWNNYDCLSKCGCWDSTQPNSFAEALTNNIDISQRLSAPPAPPPGMSTTEHQWARSVARNLVWLDIPTMKVLAMLARCVYFLICK